MLISHIHFPTCKWNCEERFWREPLEKLETPPTLPTVSLLFAVEEKKHTRKKLSLRNKYKLNSMREACVISMKS